MNITEMRSIVRQDLHDEDAANYRWADDELDRHIAHAVNDFSGALPLEQKATAATTADSREIDIASLSDRVMIEAVEYPMDQFPKRYQRYSLWNDIITLLGTDIPDGSNCYIYYGKLHTLDASGSTIPARYQYLVAAGAEGFAAAARGVYSIDKVNTGGTGTPGDWAGWGKEKLDYFRSELKRLGRRNRVRTGQLYRPCNPVVSNTTDRGS